MQALPLRDGKSSWNWQFVRYSIALTSTLLAVWGRSLLHPWLGVECPFSLFYLSVLLTAWLTGTGPALVAIVLGTLAAAHFFIPPESSLTIASLSHQVQLAIYVFVNLIALILFRLIERQRQLAENRSVENERLSQSLRDADERKDEFLALLAHELRNPLAAILSSLILLDRKPDSVEVVQRVLGIIQRQTNHLVRITDDLLDVSRFCRGKLELQNSRHDLREAISDAIEIADGLMKDKSHRFQILMPQRPVWIDGDRVRLAQLTANLLGNAAKYTPAGGRVTLQVEEENSQISIIVSDNGIGFYPAESNRIMEPFTQIDTSRTRDYGGLGLGLTIVNRLVGMHGGQLLAHSRGPGMGSCFTVSLPAARSSIPEEVVPSLPNTEFHSEQTAVASIGDAACIAQHGNCTPKILLVEDNLDAANLLGELFESEGYRIRLAHDGISALQLLNQEVPDIVILDIGLPGMDGYEVAHRIRSSDHGNHVRLLALTGWGGPIDRESTRQAGFDVHLVKPVVFRDLLEQVESLAGKTVGVSVVNSCE